MFSSGEELNKPKGEAVAQRWRNETVSVRVDEYDKIVEDIARLKERLNTLMDEATVAHVNKNEAEHRRLIGAGQMITEELESLIEKKFLIEKARKSKSASME
jgi:hypothetical protein